MGDSGGLFIFIHPSGARWWRFKFRIAGKEKLLFFGVYPDVPLKLARERRDEARRQLASGLERWLETSERLKPHAQCINAE